MSNQLSEAEIQRMRAIVSEHDRGGVVNSFDINNPPKERYVHQDFPCMVYHHESSQPESVETKKIHGEEHEVPVAAKLVNVIVHNQDELEAKLAQGWSVQPPTFGAVQNVRRRK